MIALNIYAKCQSIRFSLKCQTELCARAQKEDNSQICWTNYFMVKLDTPNFNRNIDVSVIDILTKHSNL